MADSPRGHSFVIVILAFDSEFSVSKYSTVTVAVIVGQRC